MSRVRGRVGSNPLASLLEKRGRLVADGGMGTSLFELGLTPGGSPEQWNVDYPERVAKVHRGFVDAGSDIILTNTFGGTRARLELDGKGERVEELNRAGVLVATEVASDSAREVIVAGSVGPTGLLFEPLGELTHSAAVELFTEQMNALAAAGSDIIWIETLSSTEELAAAVEAAETTGLPIVTTMSFDTHGKTMMGVPPVQLADWWKLASTVSAAIGANCGVGPADVVVAASEIRQADPEMVVVAKANCGIPQVIDGTLWYPTSADDMSAYAELALDAGARIIGACCGSVPEHIAQIRAIVDSHEPSAQVDFDDVERRLGPIPRVGSSRKPDRRRRRAASGNESDG
jgi:5-methyltetrahydrofolate--homocysteine methyltransferase